MIERTNTVKPESGYGDFDIMSIVGDLTIAIIDSEFERLLSKVEENEVLTFLAELYYGERLHLLMVSKPLTQLVARVRNSPVVQDFLLNATDRLSIYISSNPRFGIDLITILTTGLCRNKVLASTEDDPTPLTYPLLEHRTMDTIYLVPANVKKLFEDNFWLVTVVIIYLILPKTHLFESIASKKPVSAELGQS